MQRLLALSVLLVLGVASLPVAAYFLDDQGSENWIVPVQLTAVAVLGAGVSMLFPALTREGSSTRRRLLVGAVLGIVMSVVGLAVFFLLLNGFGGA